MTRLILSLVMIAFVGNSLAANADRLLSEGNRAYEAGKFDEALTRYKEASDARPESSAAAFNRGTALYRKGQFAEAASAFREAAVLDGDPAFRAKAQFNLGNCAFRQTEEGEPEATMEACRRSIESYLEALKLNPGYREAAENLELARMKLLAMEEEQRKKEEEQKKQEDQQEQEEDPLVKKLKELIQRQMSAIGENESLTPRVQDGQAASIRNLAGAQNQLQTETADLLEEMGKRLEQAKESPPQQGEDPSVKLDLAMKHTGGSINHQANALQALDEGTLDPAQASQNGSLTELKEALKALSDPQDQQQKDPSKNQQNDSQQTSEDQKQDQESQNQESKEGENSQNQKEKPEDAKDQKPEESQEEKQEPDESDPKEEEQTPNEKALETLNQTAEDILNEEKANLQRRGPFRLRQYRVEKDW